MKVKIFYLSIFLLLSESVFSGNAVDSLLLQIDAAIKNSSIYDKKKQERINILKRNRENTPLISEKRYQCNLDLYKEYKPYVCDSAIAYLNKNISLAKTLNRKDLEHESTITLAHLMGSTGMYKEAVDLISTVPESKLSPDLLIDYYAASDHIYGELALYTQEKSSAERYRKISDAFKDSLYKVLPENSELKLTMRQTTLRDNGQFEQARKINEILLSREKFGKGKYALMAFYEALSYRQEGDVEKEKYYLGLSALSDIYAATKDHASLWMLAQLLFEEGDIERAYNYISFSWSETVFYNAQLRNRQSSGILSLIDKTYQATIQKQNRKLRTYLLIISALLVLLAVALVYIYKQMKRLSIARINLQQVNNQLKVLNKDLSESNQIKEEYIGRFIKLCSTYIDKLDGYRRMVNKKLGTGAINELLKITRSQTALDNELKELYDSFDNAFLRIFPDFVSQFNELLQSDHVLLPKKGELLNTELRIFALIRLGIEDSSQIADFLRYSVNTIYNYRAKVKNHAIVSRDDFEEIVKKIR